MSLEATSKKKVIPELSDPFEPKKTPRGFYPAARRKAGQIKRWLLRKPVQASDPQALPPRTPMFLNFERDGTPPFSKKALIICETRGFFLTPEQLKQSPHSNRAQNVEIARAFNRLGYSADIMDVFDSRSIPQGRYDVVFGEHDNYGRLLPHFPKNALKIFYATRSYWRAEHRAIEERAARIKETRGAVIPVRHWEKENDWAERSDAVIVVGNDATVETFKSQHAFVQAIDNSALHLPPPDLEKKDFAEARENFLWLGSWTLLRKGLDLVLEAFSTTPNLHLWICGPLESEGEKDFVSAYRTELFHTPNIHSIGFVAPQSDTMKTLMDKCAALVFTSCAEGMSGGVLDCMAQGLVPILSREAGVDTEDFGMILEPCTVETLREAVIKFASLPPETCRRMAQAAYDKTQTRYTLAAYGKNIERLLKTAIEDAK